MTNTIDNLRGAGLSEQRPDAGQSVAERGTASRDDVAAFQRALRGDAQKEGVSRDAAQSRSGSPDEKSAFFEKAGARERAESSGHARTGAADDALQTDPSAQKAQDFLASLFRGVGAGATEAAAQTAGPAALEGTSANEALETLVSRILVSRPESGKTEVRLQIQDAVLKNTEITLARDAGGQLTVRIHTNDAAAFQTIVSARVELEARLSGRETLPVLVELQKETDREENDARRSSRGRGLFDESGEG